MGSDIGDLRSKFCGTYVRMRRASFSTSQEPSRLMLTAGGGQAGDAGAEGQLPILRG